MTAADLSFEAAVDTLGTPAPPTAVVRTDYEPVNRRSERRIRAAAERGRAE